MKSSGIATLDTMITLMLLLAVTHTGMSAIRGSEEVETNLLMKSGMTRKPVVEKNMKISSYAMELYKSMLDENKKNTTPFSFPVLHSTSANTARIYSNKGSAPTISQFKKYRLQFDIDSIPKNHQFKAAEIRFPIKNDRVLRNEEFVHVILHDIVQPGEKFLSKPILRIIDSKSINISTISKTESFDVTPFLQRLLKNDFKENHGILVQCVTEIGSHTHLLNVFDFVSPENTLLLVYTDDQTSDKSSLERLLRRNKRSVKMPPIPRKKAKMEPCRRHSMYVDFKVIGFSDWIEEPSGYEAFYCHGSCNFPLAEHMNATNHAVMQTRLHAMNLGIVPQVCCIPTRLAMQTLIYRDDDGVLQIRHYPEMTVVECGCR